MRSSSCAIPLPAGGGGRERLLHGRMGTAAITWCHWSCGVLRLASASRPDSMAPTCLRAGAPAIGLPVHKLDSA